MSYKEGYVAGATAVTAELTPLLRKLEEERDAYRRELIETLRKAATCAEGEDKDCSDCPYFSITGGKGCPSKLSSYAAKLRLEELCDDES